MTQADPFDEVVDATGLSQIIARGIVERALATVDASIESASVADYVQAMPVLRTRLAAFVDDDALHQLDALTLRFRARAGVGGWQPVVDDVPDDPTPIDRAQLQRVIRGTKGPHRYSTYVLQGSAIFGRAPAADIQILDQSVSREHARLAVRPDGSVALIDLTSRNGTWIGGDAIQQRPLRHGDLFQIGEAEYAYEETRAQVTTSKAFRDKLVNGLTSGSTSERLAAAELLASDTTEVPHIDTSTEHERAVRPTRNVLTVRGRMGHLPDSRTPTRDTPLSTRPRRKRQTQNDISLDEIDLSEQNDTLHGFGPAPVPAPTAPAGGEPAPEPPTPRSRRVTPIQPSAEASAASRRIAGTVVGMLALRRREDDGAPLKVAERAQLRRLEAGLRTPRGSDDRRRWKRLACLLSIKLNETGVQGTLLDISGGGALVSCPNLPVAEDDIVTIRVPLGEGRIAVFRARAVRIDPDRGTFGVRFLGAPFWEQTG